MSPSVQQQVPSKPSIWLVAACLLAVYVIWGTTYFAIKVGIEGARPSFWSELASCWRAHYCLAGKPFAAARCRRRNNGEGRLSWAFCCSLSETAAWPSPISG